MSHQITWDDFRDMKTEVSLARSTDEQGNWKRLTAIVAVAGPMGRFYELQTIAGPPRRFEFLSDAILAYNAEEG